MKRSSSRASSTSESSPTRKNKSQSQREYRSKEMDGFSELRDALLLADPFDTPLGRDATRHQLLITAAKKLRNLADENQTLIFRLSAVHSTGLHEPETRTPRGVTTQSATATGVTWSTQGYDMEHSLSMTSEFVPPRRHYENTIPGWSQSVPLHHVHGHQPYDMALGSSYQDPRITDMRRLH